MGFNSGFKGLKGPLYNIVSTPKHGMKIGILSHVVYVFHSETVM